MGWGASKLLSKERLAACSLLQDGVRNNVTAARLRALAGANPWANNFHFLLVVLSSRMGRPLGTYSYWYDGVWAPACARDITKQLKLRFQVPGTRTQGSRAGVNTKPITAYLHPALPTSTASRRFCGSDSSAHLRTLSSRYSRVDNFITHNGPLPTFARRRWNGRPRRAYTRPGKLPQRRYRHRRTAPS